MSEDLLAAVSLAADEADEISPAQPLDWHRAFLASLRRQGIELVRPPLDEHVILFAFVVKERSFADAQHLLMGRFENLIDNDQEQPSVMQWWIAEDERCDGSDNDSAIFVPKGRQADRVSRLGLEGHNRPVA